jgi:hypothetical protein
MGAGEASVGKAGTAGRAGWNSSRRLAGIALLLAAGCLAGCTGGAASVQGRTSAAARAGSGAGAWRMAQRIPGLRPPADELGAVACAPGGECTAIGTLGAGGLFAITDKNGTWGTMTRIPASASGEELASTEISCPAAGDCTATGLDVKSQPSLTMTIFVAQEANGTWGTPRPLPGIPGIFAFAALGGGVPITTLACATPGNCTIAGSYPIANAPGETGGAFRSFVADDVNGTWRQPAGIPGLPAVSRGGGSGFSVLSCPAPGYCALAGSYPLPGAAGSAPGTAGSTSNTPERGYVASEVNGTWGTAIQVPGATALTTAAGALNLGALSCSAPGDCVAAGNYATSLDTSAPEHAVIVAESGGTWSAAAALPGMQFLSVIDCPDAGACVAAGKDAHGNAAIVRETHGRWGTPAEIPGIQALAPPPEKGGTVVTALACPTATTCAVAGDYTVDDVIDPSNGNRPHQVFLAGEVRGTWGTALVPPGMPTPTIASYPEFLKLACAAPGNCAAGVLYTGALGAPGNTFITAEVPTR